MPRVCLRRLSARDAEGELIEALPPSGGRGPRAALSQARAVSLHNHV